MYPWLGEFHLLLLCLYNSFSLQILRCHPHTLHFFLPSLILLFFLFPPRQMHLHLRKKTWAHTDISHTQTYAGLNQPSAADMLITLHSNKTNDFLRQISVDQAELPSSLLPAISSTKTRREINYLSVSVWCWPGADSQTQSTQPEEENSTSDAPVHKARLVKKVFPEFCVGELDWPAQKLTSTSDTFGMNWDVNCKPGHQWLTSLMLNKNKFLQPGSQILWKATPEGWRLLL